MRWMALAIALLVAGCSLDSITFLGGSSDAGIDGAVDAPMIDAPSTPLGLMVSSTSLMIPEGKTRTIAVALTRAPASAVLVTLTLSDDTKVGVSPTAVLFNSTNWNMPQTITVSGKQDADTANETGTITLASADVMTPVVVSTMVTDDDGLSLMLSAASLDITEGATGTIAMHLSAQPAADVVIAVTSGNSSVATTSQAALVFTRANYAVNQTITITGMQDADTADNTTSIGFTSSALMQSSLAIQVTDDDAMGILPSAAVVTTTEGASNTFTVQLSQQPTATTTVTVMSSNTAVSTVTPATLTFTTSDYNIPQTVTISAPDDDDVADNTATVMLAATGLSTRSVALGIDDDDIQDIIAAPATTLTVAEGGTSQLALSLAFRPSGDETVTVTSLDQMAAIATPPSVTFTAANYATPQTITISGVQDPDAQPDLTSVRIESGSLGLSKDVTIDVSEDDVLGIQTSSTALVLNEGASTMLMVRLTAQPTAETTVTVASGSTAVATVSPASLTFTTSNWNTFQPVTVTAVPDVDTVASSTTLSLDAAGLPTVSVSVDSNDDDTEAIVASSTTVNVTEGSSTTVGVTLAFMPTGNIDVAVGTMNAQAATVSPAMLSFTPANWNVPQNITITGTQDADAVSTTTMVSLTGTGATAAAIMVDVTDDDSLNIDITPTTLAISEGGAPGQVQIRLTALPPATTTVMIASSDTGAVTVSPAMLTFTTANYSAYQTVTVTPVDDLDAGDEAVTLTATSTGLTMKTAAVSVDDDEAQTIVASATTVNLGEAGTATFSVHLGAQPSGNTTVTLASSDIGAATVSPAMLTFTTTNYGTDQLVTVTGVPDLDVGDETVTISATAAGIPTTNVTAIVDDDDLQSIQVASTMVTVAEGASTNVNVTLAYQPVGSVVVDVASLAPGIADVTPATLTFTAANYATPQAISISGTEDADVVGGTTSISLALLGATGATVGVTVTDNDTLGIELSPAMLTLGEGSSDTLQVRLTAQPSAATTVNLMSSDTTAVGISTTSLTFTPQDWNVFQDVTVTGVEDADTVNDNATITATSTGVTTKTVPVSVTDNDLLGIVASPATLSFTEGGSKSFAVHLTAMPPAAVTVTITNPDPGAVTVSSTTLQFTQADFATDQIVTVFGVQDADTANEGVQITLTSPALTSATVTALVTDDDVQRFLVSPLSMAVNEGGSGSFSVSLAFQPSSNVIVSLGSTNPGVAGPTVSSLTFTPTNYATAQTVFVSTVADADFNFNTAQIRVIASGIAQVLVDVTVREPNIIDVISNPTPTFCLTASTSVGIRLRGNPLNPITVAMNPSANIRTAPTALGFSSANFSTYQAVTITATASGSGSLVATSPGFNSVSTSFTVQAPVLGNICLNPL